MLVTDHVIDSSDICLVLIVGLCVGVGLLSSGFLVIVRLQRYILRDLHVRIERLEQDA